MIEKIRAYNTILKKEGIKSASRKSSEYIIGYTLPRSIRHMLFKKIHPLPNEFRSYEHPPNPFKLLWVNPANIQKFSGRDYPPYHGKNARLGMVMDGEWDKTKPKKIEPEYEPRYHLYREGATCFSQSIFYKSLQNHFLNHTPWERTKWYSYCTQYIHQGRPTTKDITSVKELDQRCQEIDLLFQKIQNEGYLSQEKLGNYPTAAKEINVDIARDGTFLFVNGRNRLTIAKILDIDKIPVGVYVRHKKWMEQRDEIINTNRDSSHPDIST